MDADTHHPRRDRKWDPPAALPRKENGREIIAEQLSVEEGSITEDSKFKEDLNADSLDLFQIISALEEEFEIEFDNEEAENLKTVGDAIEYIKSAVEK